MARPLTDTELGALLSGFPTGPLAAELGEGGLCPYCRFRAHDRVDDPGNPDVLWALCHRCEVLYRYTSNDPRELVCRVVRLDELATDAAL